MDMSDLSPPQTEENENGRAVAAGGLRRLYRSRQKARALPHPRRNDKNLEQINEDDCEDDRIVRPQNMLNHYTINMPPAPAPRPDTPHVLLG